MLVSFNKRFSGDRNALSLYFEIKFNNKVKIHKTYYEYDGFINYIKGINEDYPNIRDSETEVDFQTLLCLFVSDKTIQRLSFFKKMKYLIEETMNHEINENTINQINDFFNGCTFFNTGEFIERDEIVEIIDRKFDIIYPNENNLNDRLKPSLDNQYLDIKNLKLRYRVFDVGQANCSAILSFDQEEKDYTVACVFDLGCEKTKRNNTKLKNMIRKIDGSTTIVISHFDSDHYNLIQYTQLPPTVRWLFPSTPPKTKKGFKLFQLLLSIATKKSNTGKLYIYDGPYHLTNYLRIEEKQDNTKDLYQSTVLNANSVISIIETNKNRILIPGDALYHDFPQGVFNTYYTVVLIPHHCCYYPSPLSGDSYADIINKIVNNETIGIAQCGSNTYGHANISHLSWYKKWIICSGGTIYDDMKNVLQKFGVSKNTYIDFDI